MTESTVIFLIICFYFILYWRITSILREVNEEIYNLRCEIKSLTDKITK